MILLLHSSDLSPRERKMRHSDSGMSICHSPFNGFTLKWEDYNLLSGFATLPALAAEYDKRGGEFSREVHLMCDKVLRDRPELA